MRQIITKCTSIAIILCFALSPCYGFVIDYYPYFQMKNGQFDSFHQMSLEIGSVGYGHSRSYQYDLSRCFMNQCNNVGIKLRITLP